jgi:hypothetical protein
MKNGYFSMSREYVQKNRIWIYPVGLFVLTLGILGNSTGAGLNQGADRTGGSPFAQGSCNSCHSGGSNYNPSLSVRLLNASGQQVTTYVPGMNYQLEVVVNTQTAASRYGFQAVALTGNANTQAGSFSTATGIRVTPINNRQYAEQAVKSSSNTFRTPWTAPSAGSGDVRFYAAGLATNNNGGTSGDATASLSTPLTITELTSSNSEVNRANFVIKAFPNPVTEQLNITLEGHNSFSAQVNLYDANGRLVQAERRLIAPGQSSWMMDVQWLAAGVYWLEINDGVDNAVRLPIVK